ncbi:MAG: 2OG-Fe(II) oxygenase [Alphaproteobacteria bacterium]|nr:2OG-Fe(II) oxygenase [Alphaproteobacteria bacterium]
MTTKSKDGGRTRPRPLGARVDALDWPALDEQLDARGFATTPPLLNPQECHNITGLYAQTGRFRRKVIMGRHNYGSGEYQYFDYPLPRPVAALRRGFYKQLAATANRWAAALSDGAYPPDLKTFIDTCHRAGQVKPTPLILRYGSGDFNCLHQDLYGDIAFPLQVAICLSRKDKDFTGGEFLLVEQRPRAQSRGEAVALDQGQAIIFANRLRPVEGKRGYFRTVMRHGVSRLHSGERYTLGLIFHDAQ